jgi:hypothetical protein
MRRVTLTDGRTVEVGVRHTAVGVDVHSLYIGQRRPELFGHRATLVWAKFPDGSVVTAHAVCNPTDEFDRSVGRKVAANHLLAILHSGFDAYNQEYAPELHYPEDRERIFNTICHEFRVPPVCDECTDAARRAAPGDVEVPSVEVRHWPYHEHRRPRQAAEVTA